MQAAGRHHEGVEPNSVNSASPRTSRDALVAEILGDLDAVLRRVESLPTTLDPAEARLAQTADRLMGAAAKIGEATLTLNEAARRDLAALIACRAQEAAGEISEHLAATLQRVLAANGVATQVRIAVREELRRAAIRRTVLAAICASVVALGWLLNKFAT
jgi:hypothetical protein